MLKAMLASLDGLDEATKGLYKKTENGFILDVEGMVDKAKLDEFRTNNTELKKQLDSMKEELAKFSGVDLTKYTEAMKAIENDQEKKLLKDGKIDEVINLRTEKMRQTYEDQIKAKDHAIKKVQDERDGAFKDRDTYIVDSELQRAVGDPEMGFQANVGSMLKAEVLKNFVYKDGKVVRVKEDGSVVFGAKGEPVTIGEYLQDVAKEHPYLVKASTGGGARNNGNNSQPGAKVMKRSEFDAITDASRKAKVAREVTIVD